MKKKTKIIISGILFFATQNAAFAGHEEIIEKSISEEIGYLKSVIADLEDRVGRLEKHPKSKTESAHNEEKIDPQTGWKHRKSWLQIKEGMSEAEVESILGHPARINDMGKGFKNSFIVDRLHQAQLVAALKFMKIMYTKYMFLYFINK